MKKHPFIIVLGNEKGGTGKSTLAMHISVYLLNAGFDVCTIDVDARQGTFSQYLHNRKLTSEKKSGIKLPKHAAIQKSNAGNVSEAIDIERKAFCDVLKNNIDSDFIVVDTPGNNTFLSQLAHSYANVLITPMNESFIDLDVLVKTSQKDTQEFHPSIYAEMVWAQRKERAKSGRKPLDWIVVRNRLAMLHNKNRGDISAILEALSKRIGFRLGDGFRERVIFKELFLSGLTLLDFDGLESQLKLSHIAAKQELRELINFMKIPALEKPPST
jgi:chromosome partitioning protein